MPNETRHPEQVFYFRVATILGALAVIFGTFGAHVIEDRLEPEYFAIWKTAVEYHFYHALALLAFTAGLLPAWGTRWALWTARLWTLGVIIFSGSLYVLALTGIDWLGAITPFGGVAFILGWIFAAPSVLRSPA